jgi:hypothetical protein
LVPSTFCGVRENAVLVDAVCSRSKYSALRMAEALVVKVTFDGRVARGRQIRGKYPHFSVQDLRNGPLG